MQIDTNRNLDTLDVDELLAYQQELTRARLEILEESRRVQATIDFRAREIAARRAREDEQLGAVTKPPTQHLFGAASEVGADG